MPDYMLLMTGPDLHLQTNICLDGRRKSWAISATLEPLPGFIAEPIEAEVRLSAACRGAPPQHGDVTILALAIKATYVLTESPEGSGILANEGAETKFHLFSLSG